jgi:rare lipoprotein A
MAREAAGRIAAVASTVVLGLLLAGCGSQPWSGADGANHYAAGHPMYRVGEPYRIKGVWYYPAVDYDYDKTGIASWYGAEFDGRYTANGEIFDLNQLTAAHTTLPMPSIVQVTNLDNGRSLQLRVNDRGPFVDGRLIDVSRRAAQLLGFETNGTTPVRVKVLKDESIAAAEEAMHGNGQVMVAEASVAAAATIAASPPIYPPPVARPPVSRVAAARPWARAPTRAPIASPPAPPPRIAMARIETPPPLPSPAPPRSRAASPARSRFALIAPAEAAELPPARPPVREPKTIAATIPVPQMPPSSPRMAAEPKGWSGGIFVQAGAFSMRDNAQRVQSRIAALGSVRVMTASVNGVEMYRVRIGPLASAKQADRLLARVVGSGYPAARIVTD